MRTWLKEFHKQVDYIRLPQARIYNADQTGLFYKKLPNIIYINKAEQKNYSGNKQMEAKDRITLMVCTSASG